MTLVTYVEIINEAKSKLQFEYEPEKVEAIATYLALVLDRCVDKNCRLSGWVSGRISVQRASTQHSLNLMWSYPETNGCGKLWTECADVFASDYYQLCELFGTKSDSSTIPGFVGAVREPPLHCETPLPQINASSADSLLHIPDRSVDTIVTDPPYYSTIQYAELSDFFYVWQKRTLGDIFPDLFWSELTDKDREAVANPSRFRNMGASPEELAKQDYEAKMQLAFSEYYRVLRDDGVMISRSYPILDSSGEEVRPEVAFAEARKAIANYRFRKLVQTDTAGFDPLTQWYLLAWDAFKAREFPFDEARQLALAIGGFNVNDLAREYKLIDSASGTCKLLTPNKDIKKRAFSANADNFSNLYLVDALHAIIAIYQEEQNPDFTLVIDG